MDCIVVGGGLIGMSSARELAAAGLRVRLLERGALGREASWAGGGILSPLAPWEMPESVTRLAAWSQAAYPALSEALAGATGVDPEWTRSGLLSLEPAEPARAYAWAHARGVAHEVLDAAAVAAIEPRCRGAGSALWLPEIAQIRNPRLLRALRIALESERVTLEEHAEVTGFVMRGGRVRGVRTARGNFEAECVIVASGAWSGRLLAHLGLDAPIGPVRGQMLMYRTEPGLVRSIVLDGDRYLVPRRDGHVLVGSTLEETGFDASTTAAARDALESAAVTIVPALGEAPVVSHWAGLRPASPQGIPAIGPVPGIEGLWLNAGHFRNGVLLAPASARLLRNLVLEEVPIVDPAAYAVQVAARPA